MDALRERDGGSPVPEFPVEDRADYCPECGRAWRAAPEASSGGAGSVGWWPGLLFAVGMYLLVAYAPRAWSSVVVPGIRREPLRFVSCWMAGTEQDYTDCDPTKVLVGAGFGLVSCLVGLGAIARRAGLGRRPRRPSENDEVVDPRRGNANPLAGLVRGVWALTEATCRSLLVLLLILIGYVGLWRLVAGVPASGALVARATDQAIGVVTLALEGLP